MPFVELSSGEHAAFINVAEITAMYPYGDGVKVALRSGDILAFPEVPFKEAILEVELAEIEGARDVEI
jgi:hypothetical protein